MEKLVISVPENKSILVKQLLKELGVTIQQEAHLNKSSYKQNLAKVSTWTDEDLKILKKVKKPLET
jgi:hypothetical protein